MIQNNDVILVAYSIVDNSSNQDLYELNATTEGISKAILNYKEWQWICNELQELQRDKAIISSLDEVFTYQNDLECLKSMRFLINRSRQCILTLVCPQWYASISIVYYSDPLYVNIEWLLYCSKPERIA